MAAHALKNGLKLTDVTMTAAGVNAGGSFRLIAGSAVGTPARPGIVKITATDVTDPTTGQAMAAAYQFAGTIKTSGFSAAAMKENDVRCIQFIRVNDYNVTYAGRKDSDGMVDWKFKTPLFFSWHLDCLTNNPATSAVNFPFYDASTTTRTATGAYFPLLNDTPSTNMDLDIWNSKTGRNNFLWRFASDATFLTYLVFVHKDGTREPLEGVVWRLEREFMCKWIDGNPSDTASELTSTLTIVDKKKVLAKGDNLYKLIVDPGSTPVINIASNAPISNLRTSPSIKFEEMENYWGDFDASFWMPRPN